MSALAVLYLVFSLPIALIIHDAEEIAVQHRWMLSHETCLAERFPRLQSVITHLLRLDTKAFAIAALEELLLLLIVTAYVLLQGTYAVEVWSACFMAFSIHLLVHLVQAVVVRGYVPGLVTSLLLLPYAAYGIWSIWLAMSGMEMFLLALAGVIGIAANLWFSHWLGITLTITKRK